RGAFVVIDVNARRHLWNGRDPRTIFGLLREADVVRCSTRDLLGLWTDAASIRAAMRPTAELIIADGFGRGDSFTAAICADLLRVGDPSRVDWERALRTARG
ncbi:MAG: hypothetical protein ACXWP4_27590, partial [Polyangiales bacterium]